MTWDRLQKALRSKTVWFGILIAALSAIQGFLMEVIMNPQQEAIVGFTLSIVIIVLRFMTTDSIDDK